MESLPAIQFTQEQARAITGVSSQALRHWRKVVPYLAEKSGKAARFSFSEVIGLEIIREVVDRFGVSVGSMQAGINSLFEILAITRPSQLQDAMFVISVDKAELFSVDGALSVTASSSRLLIPCNPMLEKVRGYVFPGLPIDQQMNLPFPPHAVQR